MAKEKFTKEQMLNDLKTCLYQYFSAHWRIHANGSNCLALVNNETGQIQVKFDNVIYSQEEEKDLKFDIEGMEIADYMAMLYDYAFDGKLSSTLENDWINIDEDIAPFIIDISQMLLLKNNIDHFPIQSVLSVVDLAAARRALDSCTSFSQEHLTEVPSNYVDFKTVATLSGLDEKTVRNMANPKATNHLKTHNIKGKTYVQEDDAKEWLISRGYKETYDYNDVLERDFEKDGFYSFQNFADYVTASMMAKKIELQDIANSIGSNKDVTAWLEVIVNGKDAFFDEAAEYSKQFEFNKEYILKLAQALELNDRDFLLAVYKMVEKHKLENFQAELFPTE